MVSHAGIRLLTVSALHVDGHAVSAVSGEPHGDTGFYCERFACCFAVSALHAAGHAVSAVTGEPGRDTTVYCERFAC